MYLTKCTNSSDLVLYRLELSKYISLYCFMTVEWFNIWYTSSFSLRNNLINSYSRVIVAIDMNLIACNKWTAYLPTENNITRAWDCQVTLHQHTLEIIYDENWPHGLHNFLLIDTSFKRISPYLYEDLSLDAGSKRIIFRGWEVELNER